MIGRFDPAKDAANRAKHGLSLAFGDRISAIGNTSSSRRDDPTMGKTGSR
jgi:uncharacterized DUF497 family protein